MNSIVTATVNYNKKDGKSKLREVMNEKWQKIPKNRVLLGARSSIN